MTPESMYRLAYIALLLGTALEFIIFIGSGVEIALFTDDPKELHEVRENFIASAISLIILLSIWATNGAIIDWLLGI